MDANYDFLFKLIVVGDSNVGKSSMLMRYADGTFSESCINTIGVDFKIKTIDIDTKKIKLQVWDTAGQERFRNIVSSYYRGSSAVFVVYDVTDRESFDHIISWMREVEKYGSLKSVIHIVGNKTDLKRKVSYDEAKSYADSLGVKYIEVSAKTSSNIDKAFNDCAKDLLDKFGSTIGRESEAKKIGESTPLTPQLLPCCGL